jgi:two-component system sensor kinase FixL
VSPISRDPEDAAGRVAEARWRALIDAAVDGIIVIDSRGQIEVFNKAAERLFGYTKAEVVGKNVHLLMPEPDRSRHDGYIHRHLETGERRIIGIGREVKALRRDGESFPVHLSVGEFTIDGQMHFTAILHDLTRRSLLEEQLREAAAMARLGEMAAVIAHEVRNPLAAVRGAIQVIGSRLPAASGDGAVVTEILSRLDALNDLIQDLLVFARPPQPQLVATDLAMLLSTIGELLMRDPAFAAVRVELEGEAPTVLADPNLLTIVFQNLFINAAQAMQGKGRLRVSLSSREGWNHIEIADEGPGIAPEIRQTLFRPFHTTKARGTGLGLATARKLVDLHGGRITVACPDSGGTVVTVELPDEATRPTT